MNTRQWLIVSGITILTLLVLAVGLTQAQPPGDPLQQQCSDPYEPNGSFAQAWSLSPGIIQSYVCAPDDKDYFKFTARVGDVIHLELDGLPADYNLCLFDPYENQIACSENGGTAAEVIEEVAKTDGDHYALIYGMQGAYDPANSYTFTLQVISPSCPDPYEPNETFATAWPASVGVYHPYICASGEQDWFHITLLPLQDLQVTLTDLPKKKNYGLELFDPLGVMVASSHNSGDTPEIIRFVASAAGGAYRVRVRGVAGGADPNQPYTLKLSSSTAPPTPSPTPMPTSTPIPSCGPDPYEPNNSNVTAASIATGAEIHAYLCPETDYDWYTFYASGADEIRARLYDLPAAYMLTLYDPSGWPVAWDTSTDTTPHELTHLSTDDGDYLLRIGPTSPTSWDEDDAYALLVTLNASPPIALPAVADTYIEETDPTSTHGDERRVVVGLDEFGQEQRGLFRFDLSDVPATTIASAFFRISLSTSDSGIHGVDLLRVSAAWDEETVNWDTQPWAVSTGVSASVGGVEGQYYEWEVTDLVQSWLTGGVGNFGLELRPEAGGPFFRTFRSSEYASGMFGTGSSRAPRLIINFTEPGVGPLGSIAGRVYHDADDDGSYDAGESGVDSVHVELFRDHIGRGHQATGGSGTYAFADLPAGDYEVVVLESALPAEYELRDSGWRSVSLAAGEDRSGVNVGVVARPTPTPTPPPTLDLTAEGIEFVQVLQGEPLIRGKPTLARVYVGVTGTTDEVPAVSALLMREGWLDYISPIAPADLLPSTDPMNDPAIVGDLSRTINFILPDHWTWESHDFSAWVNYYAPDRECPGCWDAGNQYWTGISPIAFHDAEPLEVTMVEVTADGIGPTATRADTVRWLHQTYPIHTVNIHVDSLSVTGYVFTDTTGAGCGAGWGTLLSDLDSVEVFSSLGDSSTMHYYGMVDESVPHGFTGCGRTPGDVAAGIVNNGSSGRTWVEDGQTMAHEVCHNRGRPHTCNTCCTLAGCDVQHDANGFIGVYGVDLSNPAVPRYVDPSTTYDIMVCGGCTRWLSDITYAALRGSFGVLDTAGRDVGPSAAVQQYLVGSGYIVDGLVTMPRPFHRLMFPIGTSDEPGQGPYALELQDVKGNPLFTRYFDTIGDSVDPVAGSGYFRQIVPWQSGTAHIVIKEGQTVLLITPVSAHVPEVTLLSPNGGESWPPYGEHTVSWIGSDLDGDPLRYVLQYSTDDGNTWRAIATNLVGESYVLEAGRLAGSETARLRVIASDGVNTSQDTSDGIFTVEGKPPEAYILYPLDGSAILPGRPMVLEGAGTDLEDGPLSDGTLFTWSSSLEGELGRGRTLYFDDLSLGRHTITLEVADSDGFVAQDSISILVGHHLYLPLVLRAD